MNSAIEALGITRLVTDSRKILPGDTFVAYPGETMDGRNFIEEALKFGASSVIWDAEDFSWNPSWQVPNLPVEHLRMKAGEIADQAYGHPSEKLWVIGVTGTNGKTSSTHWIAQALTTLGKKTAIVGTLGNGFPGSLSPSLNTTPDAVTLHGIMKEYLEEGAQCVAMEVSSHALVQGRVNGIHFDVALLTNLTRDHLDYHGDMASYAAAKASLFDFDELKYAVLNIDDALGMEILEKPLKAEKVAYGFSDSWKGKKVGGKRLKVNQGMLEIDVESSWGSGTLASSAIGRFNASNLLGALSVLLASGCEFHASLDALSGIEPVPGRMQQLGGGNSPLVVIDYAHTPDALENVLDTLREITEGRLFCVFGCGGDRDAGKRPMMGSVASIHADIVFVTSDNPRSEDPAAIVHQITEGIEGDYCVILDRGEAIRRAIADAGKGDVVLLAGKGHEAYQEIKGKRFPFSDMSCAMEGLVAWGARC